QLLQLFPQPRVGQAIGNTPALAATVESEHQPGRFTAAAEAIVPAEAEAPVPAARQRHPPLGEPDLGVPDQRSVAEQPEAIARNAPEHGVDLGPVVVLGCRPEALDKLLSRVRNVAMQQLEVLLVEAHAALRLR